MGLLREIVAGWSCSVMVNAPVSGALRTPRWRLQIRILPGSFFLLVWSEFSMRGQSGAHGRSAPEENSFTAVCTTDHTGGTAY